MKDHSHYLPDSQTLASLLARAGLASAVAPPPTPLPGARIRFPEARARGEPSADEPELPAIEGIMISNGEQIARTVFGMTGATKPSLEARLSAFVDWLVASTGVLAAFVADSDGLMLANRHAPDNYVVATVPLATAEREVRAYVPSPSEGTTTIELDDANFLQVIRVDTTAGQLVVGLVVAGALNRATCAAVRRMLRLGVE